jgi:glycosyltransferase involved in cell wall biosynthesis
MAAREQLRVGLVHWAMPPTTGGVESHVADLALALAKLGCAVTVLTGEPAPAPLRGVEVSHIPLLNLDLLRDIRSVAGDLEAALKQVLGEVIAARGFQVVHGHNLHHFFAAPALTLDELRQELGFRLHHTFHETWPDVLHRHPVYRRWDGNYAVSRFVQNECVRQIGFRPQLRPLGVDTERFRAHRPPMTEREVPVILHPARVLPWKGVHVSVDMLAQLRRRGIAARLIITDTQRIIDWDEELISYRKQILKRLRSQGVADGVEFHSVPYGDMHLLYEEADVVVYPTVGEEPYGLVPLEAMSMSRPVVGSRSGGITETIVEGETGFLVERGDSTALADCVERLLRDPELSRHMGQAGRRHVVANFDGREYAARLVECYLSSDSKEPPVHTGGPRGKLQDGMLQ